MYIKVKKDKVSIINTADNLLLLNASANQPKLANLFKNKSIFIWLQ